jgi:hypothetical protein
MPHLTTSGLRLKHKMAVWVGRYFIDLLTPLSLSFASS